MDKEREIFKAVLVNMRRFSFDFVVPVLTHTRKITTRAIVVSMKC